MATKRKALRQGDKNAKSKNNEIVQQVIEQLQPTLTQAVQEAVQAALPQPDVEQVDPSPGGHITPQERDESDDDLGVIFNTNPRRGKLGTLRNTTPLIFKIAGFTSCNRDVALGGNPVSESECFVSSGYKMCARIYLNGIGEGKGTHMSMFLRMLEGEFDAALPWPFQNWVTVTLRDVSGRGKDLYMAFRPALISPSSVPSTGFEASGAENATDVTVPRHQAVNSNFVAGFSRFVKLKTVEKGGYIKDDTIYIEIAIDD